MKLIAREARNYTGAEISEVVRSATSFALHRNIDMKQLKKPDASNLRTFLTISLRPPLTI